MEDRRGTKWRKAPRKLILCIAGQQMQRHQPRERKQRRQQCSLLQLATIGCMVAVALRGIAGSRAKLRRRIVRGRLIQRKLRLKSPAEHSNCQKQQRCLHAERKAHSRLR